MVLGEEKRRQWEHFREKLGVDKAGKIQRARLCREYWPENCRQTMKTADELLSHTFLFQLPWDMEQTQEPVHFPEGIDWGHIAGEDPEFAYQMNRHRYWICLGQAYGLTGDEGYAREFVAQLSHWLEKEPQDGEDARLTWRTLEAGLRADYWVRAMALFADSPAVTDEVAGRFLEGLESHGRWLFENPAAGFSRKSNWGIMEYAGLYLLGLILENKEYTEKACRYLRDGLHIQVMDDGMHWEMSPMYHNEVLMACLEVLRIAALWEDRPFSGEELGIIEKMARVTLALKTPSGCQPMTGDSDDTDVRDLLSQAALILGDGQLKAGGFSRLDYESIWLFGPEGVKAYEEIKAEPLTPGLTFLPDSGQAVMRSGWGEEDSWLYFVNGPLGGGHGHQDKLHMGLWLDGEEVLQDGGRYTYKDSPMRYRLKSAKAHNVPMLWGKEYAESKDTWTYEALPQCFPNLRHFPGQYAGRNRPKLPLWGRDKACRDRRRDRGKGKEMPFCRKKLCQGGGSLPGIRDFPHFPALQPAGRAGQLKGQGKGYQDADHLPDPQAGGYGRKHPSGTGGKRCQRAGLKGRGGGRVCGGLRRGEDRPGVPAQRSRKCQGL